MPASYTQAGCALWLYLCTSAVGDVQEFRRALLIRLTCFKVTLPRLGQLFEDLLTYFCWKRLICFMRLHQRIHLLVGEPLALKDEGLPHFVQSRIVEVLGPERGGINDGKSRIIAPDDVLFSELHAAVLPYHQATLIPLESLVTLNDNWTLTAGEVFQAPCQCCY